MKLTEAWELLPRDKADEIWETVMREFSFEPDYYAKTSVYTLNIPHDIYSCENCYQKANQDSSWSQKIRDIFSKVMGKDEVMYVLDW